ncbi:MAG: YfhO family protein [Anaerolineales bacterium]|nr:YfhO family protein [Anaerolineales bacterium]
MIENAKKHLRIWEKWLWGPSICAVLVIIFYWEVLWAPADSIVGGNDLANMFRIWLDFARTSLQSGELPLWNPFLFSGVSFVSDPQPALFYPPTWIALFLPSTRALGIILVFHIWWAAVGTFGWLRSMNCSRWASLSGALVFAFSGYTFARVQAGHLGVLTTGSWLPWGLWMIKNVSENDSIQWRSFSFGAICIGMTILAGHIATFFYVLLLFGIYAVYLNWYVEKRVSNSIVRIISMSILGIGVAFIQLLPFVQSITNSTRLDAADYEFASRFSWPVGYLITLLVPNFFGEPVTTGYWGDGVYDEMIFYIGILPLLLAPIAWKAHKQAKFWAVISGIALLVAFGANSIIHRLLFRFIPFFSSLRAPARAGFLFTIAMAVLTGLAITAIERTERKNRQDWLNFYSRPWIGYVFAGAISLVIGGYLLFAWGRDSNSSAGRFWHLAGQVAMFCLLFGLAIGWLKIWSGSKQTEKLSLLAAGLIIFDLWTLGTGLVQIVPAPLNTYWRIVSENMEGIEGRVLPWGLDILQQNGSMSYFVKNVFGYNPMEDQLYNEYTSSIADPRARVYDLLNVTHVIADSPLELEEVDTLSLLVKEHGVRIYSRLTAMPRAWMATQNVPVQEGEILAKINDPDFDPYQTTFILPGTECQTGVPGAVRISSESGNSMTSSVYSGGGMVVFSERYAPGWRAWVDGEEVNLYRVDGILRGVCVPAGTRTIEMRYQPASLVWGARITLLALVVIGFLFIWPFFTRKQGL